MELQQQVTVSESQRDSDNSKSASVEPTDTDNKSPNVEPSDTDTKLPSVEPNVNAAAATGNESEDSVRPEDMPSFDEWKEKQQKKPKTSEG